MSFCPVRTVILAAAMWAATAAIGAQPPVPPGIADSVQQLRAGDAFRALLTLNDVIAQNPSDARLVARAHALRAMAYLTMNQPERARASAQEAIKVEPGFVPNPDELNAATLALFAALRAPAPVNAEAAGQASELAGQFQQAFLSYLSAYQALPTPAPREDDRRLRERIIRVVQKLPQAPVIPPDARDHARKADQLLDAEAILGSTGGASTQSAAAELTQAIRIAPWWSEATFKLAGVLQKLQRVDDALINLNLYKLTDPQGFAATAAAKSAPSVPASAAAPRPAATVPAVKTAAGTVHIYRTPSFAGGGRGKIDCDGHRIAELENGRIVTFTAPAGRRLINVQGYKLQVDVEPGVEYYFKPVLSGLSFKMRAVPPDEAKAEMTDRNVRPNSLNYVTSTECRPSAAPARNR